jgi:CheY-like chemotaxis protein
MARILSVSYDVPLLSSRHLLLESLGCEVTSISGFAQALQYCSQAAGFDLFVLGHSIPWPERKSLVAAFRTHSAAPVIALNKFGEEPTPGADLHIDPAPDQLLAAISRLISGKAAIA